MTRSRQDGPLAPASREALRAKLKQSALGLHEGQIEGVLNVLLDALAEPPAQKELATDWRQVVIDLWGDPEDCTDCLDLVERPCAAHANLDILRKLAAEPPRLTPAEEPPQAE